MSKTNNPSVYGNPELWLYDGDSATDPYLRSLDTAYTPEEGSVFVAQAAYDALSQQLAAVEAQRDQLRVERDGANERAGLLLKAKDEWAERARAAEAELDQARRTSEHWKAEHLAGNAVIDQLRAAISDPESVFVNMKRGTIAKPSLRSMLDLYGEVVNGDEAQLLEIGKLRAEVERLTAAAEDEAVYGDHDLVPSLQAEVEALRKDAERYRLLRRVTIEVHDGSDAEFDAEFDFAIDAALAAKEGA